MALSWIIFSFIHFFTNVFHLYFAETDGENMTFVPLLEGMESNKSFLGKKLNFDFQTYVVLVT